MAASAAPIGHVAIVLHAHLPWVRHPEHERSIEERWLHEALWEAYLPLVDMLDRLENEGIRAPLSISVSPPLAAMWADPMLRARSRDHLRRTRAVAERARSRGGGGPFAAAIAHHETLLARAEATLDRHRGDVLGALAHHHREGRVHLFTTAATHAFLPGLSPAPVWARAQIELGRKAFEALSGIAPRGLWLPECAFAPWIDPLLGAAQTAFTVLDAHGIALADPKPDVATMGAGEGALVVPVAPIRSRADVLYFGRDLWAGRSVWAMNGYPSDPAYREFHRDLGFDADEADLLGETGPNGTRLATGLKLHRITGPAPDKAPYDPAAARTRAAAHAAAFVDDRARLFAALQSAANAGRSAPVPVSVVPFDAELFGHFWHEGPMFLEDVLRLLAATGARGGPAAITLADAAERFPAAQRAEPATSTWGEGGFGTTWTGPRTASLWRHVHHASAAVLASTRAHRERRIGELSCPPPAALRASAPPKSPAPPAQGGERSAIADNALDQAIADSAMDQAIVEALLLQSSDFAFMIHRGTTAEYASRRAAEHAANARRLAALAIADRIGPEDDAWILALRERTPFLRELPGDALRAALAET